MANRTEQLQAFIDAAYEKYDSQQTWKEFLLSLDATERDVVVIGKFDNQVMNGGLEQWVTNGYHESLGELVHALDRVGTPNARRVAEMVEYAADQVDEVMSWDDDSDSTLIAGELDRRDDEYYKIEADFLVEVAQALL